MARIKAGSPEAHARALKAAETRRRRQSNRDLDNFIPPGSTGEMAEEMRQYRAAPITKKLRAVKNPRTPKTAAEVLGTGARHQGTAKVLKSSAKKTPAFPKNYHATPTRHVTRDLRMKAPKRKRHTYTFPASKAAIKRLDNAALQRQYRYWWQGVGRDKSLPVPARADKLVYDLRDEHNRRAAATYGDLPRIQAHRARRGVRKQKGQK